LAKGLVYSQYDSLNQTKGENTNILCQLIEALETRMNDMDEIIEKQANTIEMLTADNETLTSRCRVNEGRLIRLEKRTGDIHEETLQMNARSMKENLIFQGITETTHEDVSNVLWYFLENDLQVQLVDLEKIMINRVHRMGVKGNYTRAIVANINDEGRNVIWKHVKNLKGKDSKISVCTQLPRELAERKRQMMPHFKAAKHQELKTKWTGEKLYIDDILANATRDTIQDISLDTTEKATEMRVKRAPPKSYGGSTFQGSRVTLSDPDHAIPALHAIYTDIRSARATHNIYAYRIQSGDKLIEHYEDDAEYGAGRRLLALLQANNTKNQLVCVSKWNGRKQLGTARFNHILEAGRQVLDIDNNTVL